MNTPALDALLMPIPEIADEMDVANRLIELRQSSAAELAALKERLAEAEAVISRIAFYAQWIPKNQPNNEKSLVGAGAIRAADEWMEMKG